VVQDRHGKQPGRAHEATKRSSEPVLLVKENRLAQGALVRLAQQDREDTLDLIYLYGPSGVGKSHLVRQFVRDVQRQNPKLRLANSTASEFAGNLSNAHVNQRHAEFEAQHTALDLLVLEDLAGIQGRTAAQKMLVVILDELKRTGGRVIVTGTSLPGRLKNVIPRLVSRLRGGLCIPIDLLDEPSRLSFTRHFAERRQIPLAPQTAELLAKHGLATPRELLAAVINLDLAARRKERPADATLVGARPDSNVEPLGRSLAFIAKTVARFYGVPVSQLRSSGRLKRSVLARQVAMLLSRELSGKSSAAIANFFGRKNHTTVVHACRRTRELVAADPILAHDLEQLRRIIRRGEP
jgi:chromosomal replication initiator protein